jgi:nucleotide-binding universal stress UspA family protein
MSLERILVGVDFRQPSLAAARWVSEHFGSSNVEILHVNPVPETPGFLGAEFHRGQDANGTSLAGRTKGLRGFAETLPAPNVSTQVRVGDEVAELTRRAKTWDANMVVLGGPRASAASGRTLHRLIRNLDAPALVIGPKGGQVLQHILVALDDAPIAAALVRWSQTMAKHFGARLTLLHVLSDKLMSGNPGGVSDNVDVGRQVMINRAHAWMRELYHRAAGEPFTGRTTVAVGPAGPVLLEHADAVEADMIVVGRNGRHAVGETELGAVTKLMLRAAQVPVAVIPPAQHRLQQMTTGREAAPGVMMSHQL